MKPYALFCLLLVAALAGCTDTTETTTLTITTATGTVTFEVPFDADARPSTPEYDAAGTTRIDAYTAHDQLAASSAAGQITYEATYNEGFGAFMLTTLNGLQADASFQYWALSLNGEAAQVGMSELALSAGDQVLWMLEAFADPPQEIEACNVCPEFGVAVADASTRNATTNVTVSVPSEQLVNIEVCRAGNCSTASSTTFSGTQSFEVSLVHGQNTVVVTADDGTETSRQEHPVTRLAETTLDLRYNNLAPGYADAVYTIWFDIDALPSKPMYDANSTSHPGYANAHDLLVAWTQETENTVEFSYSESFDAFGVNRINGQGNPVTVSAPPWWCYTVNGEAADGISLQPISPGDVMLWDLGDCGFVPA